MVEGSCLECEKLRAENEKLKTRNDALYSSLELANVTIKMQNRALEVAIGFIVADGETQETPATTAAAHYDSPPDPAVQPEER